MYWCVCLGILILHLGILNLTNFERLPSGTVALPVPTGEGISDELEGGEDPVSLRTVAEVENSKLRTLLDLTELDRTGFDDDGI
jgi:hypothetical protein